jgi:hypothetical protein
MQDRNVDAWEVFLFGGMETRKQGEFDTVSQIISVIRMAPLCVQNEANRNWDSLVETVNDKNFYFYFNEYT